MASNTQIPSELFNDIVRYFTLIDDEQADPDYIEFLKDGIIKGLIDKIDKIQKRELYSKQFDKNLTQEEKEQARQAYLDMIGMHKDWRW